MEPTHLAFAAAVIILAFAVRSTAGFGSAALAVPLTALVLPVHTVIPVIASLQLVSTIDHSARNWRLVAWGELARITPFIVAGVTIGVYFFVKLDQATISKALGIFVVIYALWALANAGRQVVDRRQLPWPVSVVLNTGGAMVGALFGGASSPFYAIYLSALRLSRDAFRATMTMILMVQVALRVAGYGSLGLIDTYALVLTLFALPFMFLGARLGDFIADRITQQTFKRVLGGVLLMSGAALIWK